MSADIMNGKPKSAPLNHQQTVAKPPAVPPPPPPVVNLMSPPPKSKNTKKNVSTKTPFSRQVHSKSMPIAETNKLLPVATITKWHRFATLLLGCSIEAKQNGTCNTECTPTLDPLAPNEAAINVDTLSTSQRHILSNVIMTILSNAKDKKIPIINCLASRKSSSDGLYSSESDQADHGSSASDSDPMSHNHIPLMDHKDTQPQHTVAIINDFEEDLMHEYMHEYSNSNSGNNHCDKESLAKIVMSQKEKLLLMTSITKYVDSQHEMDTIHRACFNLWKDWYRCYGTITNQFQQAFMAVCESLLGNVDSRALAREPPLIPVNNENDNTKSVEEITYNLSTQISALKHAFAVEQLRSCSAKPAQNVSQIIDAMEPNVWLVVKHIIFEYFKSLYWTQCRYTLFNLFLDQYESVHRKLDREFISSSSFGVYTLICQLCEVHNINPLARKTSDNELELFHLDNDPNNSDNNEEEDKDHDDNDEKEDEQEIEESSSNENIEFKNKTFSNDELLETLNWYYALCRLEALLNNKRQDYLSLQIYRLYQPMFASVFQYFEHDEHNILKLIRCIVDEADFTAFKTRYESILREEKDKQKKVLNHPSSPNKNRKQKQKETFLTLLSRIIDSCMSWICRDLYYNYRTSEFCMLLTQLLADPAAFKAKKEKSRCIRIIRLHERFNLPPDQPLVNSFSCALDTGKFLHQGKIYFFKDYLCFYSNMLGIKDTQQKFLLPVTEIKTVARKVTAWVFNNAIEILMKDGRKFTFRTFMKRDTTFELLQKLMNGQIDWEAVEKRQQKELDKEKEKEEENECEGDNEHEIDETEAEADADDETLLEKRKKSVMNEISGFVMSAIDVSSAKLLSTDAKLLLQSKNKRPKTTNILPEVIEMKSMNQEIYKDKNMNAIQRNRSDPDDVERIYAPTELKKTRSAPTSPLKTKVLQKELEIKKPSSDSETVETTLCEHVDVYCNESSSNEEEFVEYKETKQQIEATKAVMLSIDAYDSNNNNNNKYSKLTKEELEQKCEELNSMHAKWIYASNPKVEKDFEVIVEFEFKDIGIEEFWDKFWSNNAIFSPIDWIRTDSMTSNVKAEEWTQEDGVIDGDEWFTRNVSCVTKLEDMPAFFPKSISQCTTEQHFRYCKVDEYFYVVHKIIEVNDIPFADCYNTHQKTEFRQSATVVMDDNDKASIVQSTHCKMYFGVEWKKSTWLKSPVRSRTLVSIKADCVKYCEEINKRILALHKPSVIKPEPEPRDEKKNAIAPNIVSNTKKKKKKRMKSSKLLNVDNKQLRIKQKENINAVVDADAYDDYDFVFRLGHNDSTIRCRLLCSCCGCMRKCNLWLIVLLVILSVAVILSSFYVFGVIITFISSVSNVLTNSAEYIHLMSSQMNYPHSNYSPQPIFKPYAYDPMQHINQHINSNNNDCNHTDNDNNDECSSSILHIEHCKQLMYLMSTNPSADILRKTYDSLDCKLVLN